MMCLNQLSNGCGLAKIIQHNFTCAGFWADLDVWQLSNAADLTWQFHHSNRAILPDSHLHATFFLDGFGKASWLWIEGGHLKYKTVVISTSHQSEAACVWLS